MVARSAHDTEAARIFLAALALFLLTTRGITVADATLHLDTAVGWLERGDGRLSFDPGPMTVTREPLAGGLFYMDPQEGVRSSQPPGMALVALPFVAVGSLVARLADAPPLADAIQPLYLDDPARDTFHALLSPLARDPRAIAYALVAPLAGALTLAWVWLTLAALGVPCRARLVAVLALGLSPLGVYAGSDWTQPVTAAALALATWRTVLRVKGRAVSAVPVGLALALAALVRPDHFVLAVPYAFAWILPPRYALTSVRFAVSLSLPLAAALVALVLYGLPRDGGGWALSTLSVGLPGLLVSPLSGLFVYSPFALLALPGLLRLPHEGRWLTLLPALQLLTYGGWFDWDASLAYGPRFLVPSLPLLAVALGLAIAPPTARVGAPALPWATRPARMLAVPALLLGAVVSLPGLLLAHARIEESHDFLHPAFVTAWRTLLTRGDDALGPGVDCASTYIATYGWLALACAALGLGLAARGRRAS